MANKIFLLILVLCSASNATLVDRSYDQLIEKSECIAFVKVMNRETFNDTSTQASIHSVYESQILDTMRCKNRYVGETIYFAAPGGVIGGTGTQINGIPNLEPDQELTVYLSQPSTSLGVPFLISAETQVAGPSGQTSAFLCTRVPTSGPSLFWANRTVIMHPAISNDPKISNDDLIDAMDWSGSQWSAPSCTDFTFQIGEPTTQRWSGYDWTGKKPNYNIVTLRKSTDGDVYSEWIYTVDALAITSVTYIYGSGEIVDADVELNGDIFQYTNCDLKDRGCTTIFDLKNTLTHEYGHVLGLDHPPITHREATKTTMLAASPKGETQKRTLAQDDIDGLCFIYPTGAEAKECYFVTRRAEPNIIITQSSGCSQSSMGDVCSLIPLLASLLLFWLTSRVRASNRSRS